MEQEIFKLKHCEHYTIPESDYGKAEVWRIWDNYFVFSIPMYGGTLVFEKSFGKHRIKDIVKLIESWT